MKVFYCFVALFLSSISFAQVEINSNDVKRDIKGEEKVAPLMEKIGFKFDEGRSWNDLSDVDDLYAPMVGVPWYKTCYEADGIEYGGRFDDSLRYRELKNGNVSIDFKTTCGERTQYFVDFEANQVHYYSVIENELYPDLAKKPEIKVGAYTFDYRIAMEISRDRSISEYQATFKYDRKNSEIQIAGMPGVNLNLPPGIEAHALSDHHLLVRDTMGGRFQFRSMMGPTSGPYLILTFPKRFKQWKEEHNVASIDWKVIGDEGTLSSGMSAASLQAGIEQMVSFALMDTAKDGQARDGFLVLRPDRGSYLLYHPEKKKMIFPLTWAAPRIEKVEGNEFLVRDSDGLWKVTINISRKHFSYSKVE